MAFMGDASDLIVEAERDEGTLDVTVKARIDREQKAAIDAIARSRQLRSADIVREALRFYLHEHPAPKAVA